MNAKNTPIINVATGAISEKIVPAVEPTSEMNDDGIVIKPYIIINRQGRCRPEIRPAVRLHTALCPGAELRNRPVQQKQTKRNAYHNNRDRKQVGENTAGVFRDISDKRSRNGDKCCEHFFCVSFVYTKVSGDRRPPYGRNRNQSYTIIPIMNAKTSDKTIVVQSPPKKYSVLNIRSSI